MNLIVWLVVGGLIGWVASMLMHSPEGILMNVVVGIVGAFIGGWLLPKLGIVLAAGIVGVILTATIGAVVLLLLIRLIRRA
jgi:uncharacterized membrane protein YeaQ/YmgE (transglycosylase-associated protein family)